MSDIIVAITGNRNITAADRSLITRRVRELVYEVRPHTIIFGGARGVDTEALIAAQHLRSHGGRTAITHSTQLVVIVPDTVAAQPHDARAAIYSHADDVIELHRRITYDDGWTAYHARNRAMVDRATHVLGFWSGEHSHRGIRTSPASRRGDDPASGVAATEADGRTQTPTGKAF